MKYIVAERFKSIQGEGLYAGTPMAFIRFVGCSVGKQICHHCDTVFERTLSWQGGGEFTEEGLLGWAENYDHICLTGGEPLDQDLQPLLNLCGSHRTIHVETSGTKLFTFQRGRLAPTMWVCVSPKPGFLEEVVMAADEVKVIVPGLGTTESLQRLRGSLLTLSQRDTFYWPTLEDALRWAAAGKLVYLQPQNEKMTINQTNLMYVQDLLRDYPQLRLSTQMHKILKVQ